MKEKENLLRNLSLSVVNKWIKNENDPVKKEAFRCLKADKMNFNNSKMSEQIKVIRSNLLGFDGFCKYDKKIKELLESNNVILERSYAEFDDRYRQLVSNGLLLTYDVNKNEILFGFQKRNTNYTEKTLIGTLGMVGGHINRNDNSLYEGLIREMSEEISNVPFEEITIKPAGFIQEFKTQGCISNYHLCVLYLINIPYECIGKIKNKESQERLIWIPQGQLLDTFKKESKGFKMDSWIEILLNEIFNKESIKISEITKQHRA